MSAFPAREARPAGSNGFWAHPRSWEMVQVVFFSLLAAVGYGVVHDEITVRVCLEYFTVAHPPLFPTHSPTLLAICWGTAATFVIGLGLGSILALVSQAGTAPPWTLSKIRAQLLWLLAGMGTGATVTGIIGFFLSRRGTISLPFGLAHAIPVWKQDRFIAVWFAHNASYAVGLTGSVWLCLRAWWQRGRPAIISVVPTSPGSAVRAAAIAVVLAWVVWWRFHAR